MNPKRKIKKFIKKYLGLQIYRVDKAAIEAAKSDPKMEHMLDPADSYMIKQDHKNLLMEELSSIAEDFLKYDYYPDQSNQSTICII